jgi:hypothetical protein
MYSLNINFFAKYNDRYNLYFSFVYHIRTINCKCNHMTRLFEHHACYANC